MSKRRNKNQTEDKNKRLKTSLTSNRLNITAENRDKMKIMSLVQLFLGHFLRVVIIQQLNEFFYINSTFLPVSPPEHDRHVEHAGGSVRERSGVSFSPDQEKERRQGGQCVVIPDPFALFCSALCRLSTAGVFVPVCSRHRSVSRPRSAPLSSFYLPRCSPSVRSDILSSIYLLHLP